MCSGSRSRALCSEIVTLAEIVGRSLSIRPLHQLDPSSTGIPFRSYPGVTLPPSRPLGLVLCTALLPMTADEPRDSNAAGASSGFHRHVRSTCRYDCASRRIFRTSGPPERTLSSLHAVMRAARHGGRGRLPQSRRARRGPARRCQALARGSSTSVPSPGATSGFASPEGFRSSSRKESPARDAW